MITIKLEFRQQALNREVHTCDSYAIYTIETHDATGVTQLILFTNQEGHNPVERQLYTGTKGYAMNDYGATIDTIYGTSMPKDVVEPNAR